VANGLFLIATGKKERGEPVTAVELSAASDAAKSAEAKLKLETGLMAAAEKSAQSAAELHSNVLARAESAKAIAADAERTRKMAEDKAKKAAAEKIAAQAAAGKADKEAHEAAISRSQLPPVKPKPAKTVKQQELDALLELYMADKIDPITYHQQRARIVAEPDVK
jgi:colicin import membrane protein